MIVVSELHSSQLRILVECTFYLRGNPLVFLKADLIAGGIPMVPFTAVGPSRLSQSLDTFIFWAIQLQIYSGDFLNWQKYTKLSFLMYV